MTEPYAPAICCWLPVNIIPSSQKPAPLQTLSQKYIKICELRKVMLLSQVCSVFLVQFLIKQLQTHIQSPFKVHFIIPITNVDLVDENLL